MAAARQITENSADCTQSCFTSTIHNPCFNPTHIWLPVPHPLCPCTPSLSSPAAHKPLGLASSTLPHQPLGCPRGAARSLRRQWTTAKPGGRGDVSCNVLPFFLDLSLAFAPGMEFFDAVKSSVDSEVVFQATLQVRMMSFLQAPRGLRQRHVRVFGEEGASCCCHQQAVWTSAAEAGEHALLSLVVSVSTLPRQDVMESGDGTPESLARPCKSWHSAGPLLCVRCPCPPTCYKFVTPSALFDPQDTMRWAAGSTHKAPPLQPQTCKQQHMNHNLCSSSAPNMPHSNNTVPALSRSHRCLRTMHWPAGSTHMARRSQPQTCKQQHMNFGTKI